MPFIEFAEEALAWQPPEGKSEALRSSWPLLPHEGCNMEPSNKYVEQGGGGG